MLPVLGISLVNAASRELAGASRLPFPDSVVAGGRAISLVALVTIALSTLFWLARRALLARRLTRHEETWACGYDAATSRMQYTASSFAAPLLGIFGGLGGVRVERTTTSLRTRSVDPVLDTVALPLWSRLRHSALRLRAIQQGRLHFYLLYVMAALLVLLGYLAFGSRL